MWVCWKKKKPYIATCFVSIQLTKIHIHLHLNLLLDWASTHHNTSVLSPPCMNKASIYAIFLIAIHVSDKFPWCSGVLHSGSVITLGQIQISDHYRGQQRVRMLLHFVTLGNMLDGARGTIQAPVMNNINKTKTELWPLLYQFVTWHRSVSSLPRLKNLFIMLWGSGVDAHLICDGQK